MRNVIVLRSHVRSELFTVSAHVAHHAESCCPNSFSYEPKVTAMRCTAILSVAVIAFIVIANAIVLPLPNGEEEQQSQPTDVQGLEGGDQHVTPGEEHFRGIGSGGHFEMMPQVQGPFVFGYYMPSIGEQPFAFDLYGPYFPFSPPVAGASSVDGLNHSTLHWKLGRPRPRIMFSQ